VCLFIYLFIYLILQFSFQKPITQNRAKSCCKVILNYIIQVLYAMNFSNVHTLSVGIYWLFLLLLPQQTTWYTNSLEKWELINGQTLPRFKKVEVLSLTSRKCTTRPQPAATEHSIFTCYFPKTRYDVALRYRPPICGPLTR
jgi:hypothetical protein